MSESTTDIFWETLASGYLPDYVRQCKSEGVSPTMSGFQVWADELGLVPEPYDE